MAASVFLLFSGLMLPSSLWWPVWCPLETCSGRFSDDCERLRAFWADPRIPSRLKLGVRADFKEVGDFSECTPLVEATSWGEGISIVKSRFGRGNCLTTLLLAAPVMVPTERGESPLDDGDMPSRRVELASSSRLSRFGATAVPCS